KICFEVVSKREGKGLKNVLKRFTRILSEWMSMHQIGEDIKDIKSRMSDLTKQLESMSVADTSSRSVDDTDWSRKTYGHEIEEHFVGMKKGHRKVTITSDNNGLKFVPGCISQQFQPKTVFQRLLKQLLPNESEEQDEDALVRKLYKVQKDKKCLVVLDDVWEVDHWNCLRRAFPIAEAYSKVLLTTRNQNIASAEYIYKLECLSEDEGWELLQKIALSTNYSQELPTTEITLLEEYGRNSKTMWVSAVTHFSSWGNSSSGKNPLNGKSYKFKDGKLPKGIEHLILLKLLSIKGSNVEELPASICKLPCLQSLNLQVNREMKIPNLMYKLRRLRHLYMPDAIWSWSIIIGGGKLKLDGLNDLETLIGFSSSKFETTHLLKLQKLRVLNGIISDDESLSMIVDHILNHQDQFHNTQLFVRKYCNVNREEDGSTLFRRLVMCHSLSDLRTDCGVIKLPTYECHMLYRNVTVLTLEKSNGGRPNGSTREASYVATTSLGERCICRQRDGLPGNWISSAQKSVSESVVKFSGVESGERGNAQSLYSRALP
ncbi:UNVERIFIED_CONTAM: putative disease resistance protein, partial [Sesamum calycinum]